MAQAQAATPLSLVKSSSSVFDKPWLKVVLTAINLVAIITVFIFTGLTGVDPATANDFRKNFIVIIVCSIVFMIAWAALSLLMFAANPEQATYYFFIMIAIVLGLSFMSVSVSVMNKLTGSN